jgi:hypothetical protein
MFKLWINFKNRLNKQQHIPDQKSSVIIKEVEGELRPDYTWGLGRKGLTTVSYEENGPTKV